MTVSIIIDCETDDLAAAAAFWAQALRRPLLDPDEDGAGRYAILGGDPRIEVQLVGHPSRVHLDLEADDVAAEVQRLVGLGATVEHHHERGWCVMQAPTGQRFCVIPAKKS